jgi:hypothetical protein
MVFPCHEIFKKDMHALQTIPFVTYRQFICMHSSPIDCLFVCQQRQMKS